MKQNIHKGQKMWMSRKQGDLVEKEVDKVGKKYFTFVGDHKEIPHRYYGP